MKASMLTTILAVALAEVPLAPVNGAVVNDPQCVGQAAHELHVCKQTCREQFQTSKDLCRNIDHDCGETCRAGLDACLDGPDGPLTQFEACRLVCSDTLAAAVQDCRDRNDAGTPERDQCIDGAQVAAFVCRDNCREAARSGIVHCRVALRACIVACPPPAD